MFTLVFVCGKGEVRDVHWTSVEQIMVRGVHGTSTGQLCCKVRGVQGDSLE